ncbi:ArsR/SmtB family transcription factor [Halobellus limi]|jgi:DNA-binding transcriptional ArsR family regulator|uniref:Helix-turn-helix domain-containing protein n=1 Tax=Halobellus limi TaxID=699433 RepID=A0A1H5VH32_9EURY|nr:winged helix-turn-helix domain-containing protein [Halobellus limi]QCC46713.1 MarR family transcriptional regulator [Halobellus limi]SEF86629.1 Helix-turn-helix domain-containing protein [Halobellus limi]
MADILPSRPDLPDDDDREPRVVGLDSEEVDDLLAAISSTTARELLAELHDEPGPPSDVADRVDTSIQNAQYHLDRLETAGLIESVGTAYSEKGREMTVYAPSDQALVVVAGDEDDTTGLQSALTQLLGGLGVVALGSVVVDRLARTGTGPIVSLGATGGDGGSASGGAGSADGGANLSGATETEDPPGTGTETAAETETATPAPEQASTETPDDGGGVQIAEATETPTAEPTATPTSEPTATPAPTEAPSTPTETVAEATRTAADAAQTVVETTQTAAGGGDGPLEALSAAIASLPPGALFFVGGVVALSFVALVWRQ